MRRQASGTHHPLLGPPSSPNDPFSSLFLSPHPFSVPFLYHSLLPAIQRLFLPNSPLIMYENRSLRYSPKTKKETSQSHCQTQTRNTNYLLHRITRSLLLVNLRINGCSQACQETDDLIANNGGFVSWHTLKESVVLFTVMRVGHPLQRKLSRLAQKMSIFINSSQQAS